MKIAQMAFATLSVEEKDGVAVITLNRPDAQNAINLAMTKDLMQAAIACDEDAAVRAVLFTGAGKIFSVGGDIREFTTAGDELPALAKEMTTYLHSAVSRFQRMDAPVVSAVNGIAAGGGFSLACGADIVFAAESARFNPAFTRSGLSPDTATTYFLPRLVGWRRARELLLRNPMLDAKAALEWGLVNYVVADDHLYEEAKACAVEFAAGATQALGATKRLLLSSAAENLESQMELEARAIADSMRTSDLREGLDAFLAKRKPRFTGD